MTSVVACPACGLRPRRRLPAWVRPRAIEAGVVVGILALIASIVVPNLRCGPKPGNEYGAICGLRTIASAEFAYLYGSGPTAGHGVFGSLADLAAAGLLDEDLGAGVAHGYRFSVTPGPAFTAVASPLTPGQTGDRHFGVDATSGSVWYSVTAPFVPGPGGLVRPPDALAVSR